MYVPTTQVNPLSQQKLYIVYDMQNLNQFQKDCDQPPLVYFNGVCAVSHCVPWGVSWSTINGYIQLDSEKQIIAVVKRFSVATSWSVNLQFADVSTKCCSHRWYFLLLERLVTCFLRSKPKILYCSLARGPIGSVGSKDDLYDVNIIWLHDLPIFAW